MPAGSLIFICTQQHLEGKMRNIFFLYIPPGNLEAIVHYQDTIINKVSLERVLKYVDSGLKSKIRHIFGNKPIPVWGSRDSTQNRAKFERMSPGDDILIIEGDTIKLLGKIAAKTINPDLSRELWKNLKNSGSNAGWDLIYFIANPMEVNLPFSEIRKLFNYSQDYTLRGFSHISDNRLKEFYNQYDDLYSILQRIKLGEKIQKKNACYPEQTEEVLSKVQEDSEQVNETSEHISMQWKLIQLGMKAGSKIWIPKNDQQRISSKYKFSDFEQEFTAGIDVPAKYVENIDVVWKEEFRIDAAFEVENTTAIYSGLLRFSDLKIVAPNSNYPLFIVAPYERRNRVIEQVKRPTFRRMDFEKKVKFLSYEVLSDIDHFFQDSDAGLNVELLVGRAESI
jgi:hypothetical protein